MKELINRLWNDSTYFASILRGGVFIAAYFAWKQGWIDPELRSIIQGGTLMLPAGERNQTKAGKAE